MNSVIIFLFQMTLLKWLTCLLESLTVNLIFLLFWTTMTFSPLGNSDHVVVSVSFDFLLNSKWDARFHHIAYDYSCADWDGLHNHLKNLLWEDIFKLSLLLVPVNFLSWFRLELMYISVIKNIRSNLTHLHGFQQLVLLP